MLGSILPNYMTRIFGILLEWLNQKSDYNISYQASNSLCSIITTAGTSSRILMADLFLETIRYLKQLSEQNLSTEVLKESLASFCNISQTIILEHGIPENFDEHWEIFVLVNKSFELVTDLYHEGLLLMLALFVGELLSRNAQSAVPLRDGAST